MAVSWTKEKVEALPVEQVKSLRRNATQHGAADVVALCDEVLAHKRAHTVARTPRTKPVGKHPRLVPKTKAMEMRGVKLRNSRWSWGAIRESDHMAVLTIWAQEVLETPTGCEFLLWGPNLDGTRPWAGTLGGKERERHCEWALAHGGGEGVVIYGARRGKDIPADEASRVEGADPHLVIRFSVEKRGPDYWAVWEGKPPKV